jgi:hypothetical protein
MNGVSFLSRLATSCITTISYATVISIINMISMPLRTILGGNCCTPSTLPIQLKTLEFFPNEVNGGSNNDAILGPINRIIMIVASDVIHLP